MTPAAFHAAFDRIEDFVTVQCPAVNLDAILRLQEAVGIDDDERAAIAERIESLDGRPGVGDVPSGAVLLGMILGLFAAGDEG